MTTFELIGLISALATIAGLIYTVWYARSSRRIKLLVYDATDSIPLATTQSPEEDYKLSVLFQREGQKEERISSVHVSFLESWNHGKEPIRRLDIARANPLRIKISECRVLDIAISKVSRPVTQLAIKKVVLGNRETHADVSFDFLDYLDGCVVRILSEGVGGKVSLTGDIIGMPSGIKRSNEVRSLGILNKVGCTLGVLFQISSLIVAVMAFRWITGSWQNIWVLSLPFIALIIPGIIFAIIASTIWPDQEVSPPSSLTLPKWFEFLHYRERDRIREGQIPPMNETSEMNIGEGKPRKKGPKKTFKIGWF